MKLPEGDSFAIQDSILDSILTNIVYLSWERQTLKLMPFYIAQLSVSYAPYLLPPDMDYCPSLDFANSENDTVEPLNSALDIYSQEKMNQHREISPSNLITSSPTQVQFSRSKGPLVSEYSDSKPEINQLTLRKQSTKRNLFKAPQPQSKPVETNDQVGVLKELANCDDHKKYRAITVGRVDDDQIEEMRLRKVRELLAKQAKDRERAEHLKQERLLRMQQATDRSQAHVNLVTEDMCKRIKVDKLPKLIDSQTQSSIVKVLKSQRKEQDDALGPQQTTQQLSLIEHLEELRFEGETNLSQINVYADPFTSMNPQSGVTVKELKGNEGAFGLVKKGQDQVQTQSMGKRMTMSQYQAIRSATAITLQRKMRR